MYLAQKYTRLVVYHLPKFSGKSGWKVNGTWLFWAFQRKISGSNGTSEKVVLFFRTECPIGNSYSISSKPSLTLGSDIRGRFIGKWNLFVQMVNAIPGRDLPVLNFAYHLPRLWTYRFVHENGKQTRNPLCSQALYRLNQFSTQWNEDNYLH